MTEFLPSFFGLTFIGFVWALPVLIPALRRWLRGSSIRRLTAVVLFSGSLLYLTFLVISFLVAQFSSLLICNPSIFNSYEPDWDTTADEMAAVRAEMVVCNDEKAAQLGFANGVYLETAVNQELFRRNRTLPPFRQNCYADNPAFCEFVSPSPIGDDYNLFGLIVAGWPAFVTALLVWLWTRPQNSRSILAELVARL